MYFTAKYYYYHNHGYKSYISFLKALITGKNLITAGLDIDRIRFFKYISFFYDKTLQICRQHRVWKFYRHILSKYPQIPKHSPPLGTPLPLPTNFRKVILYNSKNNDVSSVIFDAYLKI